MRLFVAIVPPAGVRRELERRRGEVAPELPRCRWVPEANLHLTLLFLGETEAEGVEPIGRELAAAFAGEPPFAARWERPGCFPPRGAPRVLWLGIAPAGVLARLHRRVVEAVRRAVSVPGGGRRFHPHLTLGRCVGRWERAAVERFERVFAAHLPGFEVREGALVESRLGPGGARYRPLGRYPLGAAA